MGHNLRKYPRKCKVKTINITGWKQIVRTITYAKYVQNSIFLSFLSFFVVIVFFGTFVFRHRHSKIDHLEMVNQFTRQKKLIILPDDVLSRIKNEAVFKVTASAWRRAGVWHPLVTNDFQVNFHNHLYFILSKHNYCLGVYSKSEK